MIRTAILGGLLLGSCAPVQSPSPATPRIVFASARSGNGDIYIANRDGSELRQLTSTSEPDQFPRCSPDRRSIVFVRGEGQAAEIYRLDLATGAEQRLTENEALDSTPGWSADGSQIYFTRRDGAHDRIAVMDAAGGEVRFLTDGTTHDVMPAASPDGRSLVHHTYRYGKEGVELQMIDLASGQSRRLTSLQRNDYEASFAGNEWVLFSTNMDGDHYRLYVAEVETHSVHLLADTGADAWGARYSPATGDVLFYTGSRDNWRMMRVPFKHRGPPQPVLDDGQSNSGPDWC